MAPGDRMLVVGTEQLLQRTVTVVTLKKCTKAGTDSWRLLQEIAAVPTPKTWKATKGGFLVLRFSRSIPLSGRSREAQIS
ncbi:hypothetical protein Naga_100342g2 [Nannochloropsis gaditana]|uniref:Uncharacterized protein n=1 Tax=Nannochloropsis gaditana TaxID=72520 RepID=W7TB85_9STRA|nr:hypothetical protein Naga_100342g2 [Nannochloropsis gaditana]